MIGWSPLLTICEVREVAINSSRSKTGFCQWISGTSTRTFRGLAPRKKKKGVVLQGDADLFGVLPQRFRWVKAGFWTQKWAGSLDALRIVYDWFMDVLWLLYGWFLGHLWVFLWLFTFGNWPTWCFGMIAVASCRCTKSGMFAKYQTLQVWWVSRISCTQLVVPIGPQMVAPMSGGICSVLVTCITFFSALYVSSAFVISNRNARYARIM